MKIDEISLKIIPDSRGKDTLEVTLKSGEFEASASVPSGKSTGATEAATITPQEALEKLPILNEQVRDEDFESLELFDDFFRGQGANLTLALSIAFVRLLAKSQNLEVYELISKISGKQPKLPLCLFNLINGGLHAQNSLPFQEYLFIPQTNSPRISLDKVMSAIDLLKDKIQSEYGEVRQGDEGGFTVPSDNPLVGLQLLSGLGERTGLDIAASTMQQKPSIEYIRKLAEEFNVFSTEDPCDEEDWEGFSRLTELMGDKVWIIGDDLLTTNVDRIKKAHELRAVNAALIKPNQIGTVTETIQAANLAKSYGWKIVVSHRSGETMDTFIADLAVGLGADGLKSGCPLQKERLVKYERLIEIEEKLKVKS